MPYKTEWIEPDVFLEHNGVTIYYAYKNDDYGRRLEYWFCVEDTNPETSKFDSPDPDGLQFDSRVLPLVDGEGKNWMEDRIVNAIEKGILADGRVPTDSGSTTCNICGKSVYCGNTRLHQGKLVGDCCWDERLKITE
jgi:hypothetical protein